MILESMPLLVAPLNASKDPILQAPKSESDKLVKESNWKATVEDGDRVVDGCCDDLLVVADSCSKSLRCKACAKHAVSQHFPM